jgi:hypothetical protein
MSTNDNDAEKTAFIEKINEYYKFDKSQKYKPKPSNENEKKWLNEHYEVITTDIGEIEKMNKYINEHKCLYYFYKKFHEYLYEHITEFEKEKNINSPFKSKNDYSNFNLNFDDDDDDDDDDDRISIIPKQDVTVDFVECKIETNHTNLGYHKIVRKENKKEQEFKSYINGKCVDLKMEFGKDGYGYHFNKNILLFQDDKFTKVDNNIKIGQYINLYNKIYSENLNTVLNSVRLTLGRKTNLSKSELKKIITTHYKNVLDKIKLIIDEFEKYKPIIDKYKEFNKILELSDQQYEEILKEKEEAKLKQTELENTDNYKNFLELIKKSDNYCYKKVEEIVRSPKHKYNKINRYYDYNGSQINCLSNYDVNEVYGAILKHAEETYKQKQKKLKDEHDSRRHEEEQSWGHAGGKKTKRNKKSKKHKSLRKTSIRNKTRRQRQ